jgi:nucleoside-diphosphate-sugar epimerase
LHINTGFLGWLCRFFDNFALTEGNFITDSMKETILVIGSSGQIGTELVQELRKQYGENHVIASDLRATGMESGPFEELDVMNRQAITDVVKQYKVTQVYLLAALLSATAEKNPMLGWKLNMEGLFNILELAREKHIAKVYWPSSIAVFGPNTPKDHTPQFTVMEPSTVYGISKQAGERWCEYYYMKYGVDVRSIRYPGLIGWKSAPGGGTTDYAVHIFHEALKSGSYDCFLSADTTLPMMYMPDAIKATLQIMHADARDIKIRSSYNLGGISFSPKEIAAEIRKHIPDFKISFHPDFRQAIADSWPRSIDDSKACQDWAWKPSYSLKEMTSDMLLNLKKNNSIIL